MQRRVRCAVCSLGWFDSVHGWKIRLLALSIENDEALSSSFEITEAALIERKCVGRISVQGWNVYETWRDFSLIYGVSFSCNHEAQHPMSASTPLAVWLNILMPVFPA